MTQEPRPDFVIEVHLYYLDLLRESGATNMFGAAPYLEDEYPDLTREQCRQVLAYRMRTFGERHQEDR